MIAARRALLGSVLVLVLGIAASAVFAQAGGPSRPVDTDISNYVLFGFDSVAFKGANLAGRGIIRGGNVGANGLDPGAPDPTVNICANGRATMSEGSQLVADTLRANDSPGNPCVFWDVFANRLAGGSSIGNAHSGPNPVTLPVVEEPPLPAMSCNAANPITVRKGDPPFTLPPGTYGAVEFQDGTEVTMQAGLYQMCSLHTGQDVRVHIGVATELRITGAFTLGNGTLFGLGLPCAARVYVRGDGVAANDSTINFGKNSTVIGHFLTTEGRINLGNGTNLVGTFWGRALFSDFDVNVDYCPPLGEYAVSKTIAGDGAGSQDEIQIDIECVPSPPNSSIPPFVIPPGATGVVSTVVTGVTLPAVCRASEPVTGDNDQVDVFVGFGSGGVGSEPIEVPVCPDVGSRDLDALTGRPHTRPEATIVDRVETTTTSSSSTTSSSTTSSSTTSSTTSSTSSTTTSLPPPTVLPDVCVLPAAVTSSSAPVSSGPAPPPDPGDVLPDTGGSASPWPGVFLIALGSALVLAGRRRTSRT